MQFDRLKRRQFITLVASMAMTWPRTLVAQGIGSRRIGVLMELAADEPQARSNVAALQRGLYKLGWSQGSNLGIDYRWAPDDPVLVWKYAKELVELQRRDCRPLQSVVATLLGQTRNIPIVFVSISDPIGEACREASAIPVERHWIYEFRIFDDRKMGGVAQRHCPEISVHWLPIQPTDDRRRRIVFPASNR
jgi:hypothetical protein